MKAQEPPRAPRWQWGATGPRLHDADVREYRNLGDLDRIEVDRLLALGELDVVRVECGSGIAEWATASDSRRLWLSIERDFRDVHPWKPPMGAPGTQQYYAQLWRADSGRHLIVFTNE